MKLITNDVMDFCYGHDLSVFIKKKLPLILIYSIKSDLLRAIDRNLIEVITEHETHE